MIIEVTDDFDLLKISESGQCFRVKRFCNDVFRFITQNHVLYITKISDIKYSVSCSADEWIHIWFPYFDLGRQYCYFNDIIPSNDLFLKQAYEEGRGIRILLQDHWETLISFIISQRKNIPAIKSSIELIASHYGNKITTPYETVYSFPTPEEMIARKITLDDLHSCKVGYRADYIWDALSYVIKNSAFLEQLSDLTDAELFNQITEIHGVGKKVANCVCLFSYSRTSIAPVDTWIQKVINTYYNGINPFPSYGNLAGIMQQYIFYYTQKHKADFKNE